MRAAPARCAGTGASGAGPPDKARYARNVEVTGNTGIEQGNSRGNEYKEFYGNKS